MRESERGKRMEERGRGNKGIEAWDGQEGVEDNFFYRHTCL